MAGESLTQEEVNIFVKNLVISLKRLGVRGLASVISKHFAGDFSISELVKENIIYTVCGICGVSRQQLQNAAKSRKQELMEAKILCILLFARYITTLTHKEIGDHFGVSRTTVTHTISTFRKSKTGKINISDRYSKIFSKSFMDAHNICVGKVNIFIENEKNKRLID